MGKDSGVTWAHHSWGCWRGCRKVRPEAECKNCYAARDMKRYGKDFGTVVRAARPTFNGPLKWPAGRVFVCPWSDFWIEDADDWRDDAYAVMRQRPDHTYIIPTKRPENIMERLPDAQRIAIGWSNVWGLVSAGTQETADLFVPTLLRTPFAVRGVSAEPLLEYIDFTPYTVPVWWCAVCGAEISERVIVDECPKCGDKFCISQSEGAWQQDVWLYSLEESHEDIRYAGIDWLVIGIESAHGRRVGRLGVFQSEQDWIDGAVTMVEQARQSGVKVFVKQVPINGRVNDNPADWIPELRYQEFPE